MAQVADLSSVAFLQNIPIELVIELGRTQLTVKELASLEKDDVVELNRLVSQPLDIVTGGRVIARGEVVIIEDAVGVRIIELVGRDDEGR